MTQDKMINKGNEMLFTKDEWVDPKLIQGTDKDIIEAPIMVEAFERVLKQYSPKKDIALVSLCTKIRPYSQSPKWDIFMRLFKKDADLIVASNGGLVPEKFWYSYPYLNYDGQGPREYEQLYIDTLYDRIERFFTLHEYETIVFNFRPTLKNVVSARRFKEKYGHMYNIHIIPDEETYNEIKLDGFPNGRMQPDLDQRVLKKIKQAMTT